MHIGMKRIYFILASLLLFVSCSFEREVRDDLYEAKISVIKEQKKREQEEKEAQKKREMNLNWGVCLKGYLECFYEH